MRKHEYLWKSNKQHEIVRGGRALYQLQPDTLTHTHSLSAGWLGMEVAGVVLFHLQTLAQGD